MVEREVIKTIRLTPEELQMIQKKEAVWHPKFLCFRPKNGD